MITPASGRPRCRPWMVPWLQIATVPNDAIATPTSLARIFIQFLEAACLPCALSSGISTASA